MPSSLHPGQRWISETEPELGLGRVERVSSLTVTLSFRATGETREYARDNAPIRRVRFHAGDRVKDREGHALRIVSVAERDGLLEYRSEKGGVRETDLADAITFSTPTERLFVGQADEPAVFDLRVDALNLQYRRRKSLVRGFVGGRIDLIPHQLHIAAEVAGRLQPRVLLADEVGLGKTIEACLILHRLLLTGRAQRVLILVPDSLVHQWLVEMLRRFNLWFHIFDEERCAALEAANPEANPFLDDQLVLASISLFTGREKRVRQALDAEWDVLVVDEAHHLGWSPHQASPEYAVVEALGRKAPGLLLLTATPEQLGMASHFARLRLLDPARFHDLDAFLREALSYREVAREAATLRESDTVEDRLALDDLLDQHGTGRVMFRNTRDTISGFPKRTVREYPLDPGSNSAECFGRLRAEFQADIDPDLAITFRPDLRDDPRISWLLDLLRRLDQEKVLLICRTRAKAEAIEEAVRPRLNLKMAVFHEGLTLVQRDRHAAWFAEEDGARLLICSEIGSEGRNFQFAHHLVMFDLPLDPELVEQRIGRLDRIGQTSAITLHVPFVTGSAQEVLARWYHAGLNAFEKNLHGGHELFERFGTRLRALAGVHEPDPGERGRPPHALDPLIAETVAARQEIAVRLREGRDVLLEMNSFRKGKAAKLVEEIGERDQDSTLDAFMIAMFDYFTIPVEQLSPRTYRLGSAGSMVENFPGLPASGLTVTCSRERALAREDVQFLTWDHPLVSGALDLFLGSGRGNSSFGRWPGAEAAGLYVESIYVLECVAPAPLHADRFLPPTPLRVLIDQRGRDVSDLITPEALRRALVRGDPSVLQGPEVQGDLRSGLVEASAIIANGLAPAIIARARQDMSAQLDHEIARLRELRRINRSVRPEEINLLVHEKALLDQHLAAARLRLDAIRLIQRQPE